MRPHRRAAAVAVAIGLLGCTRPRIDHGVAEAAPPPYDRYRIDEGVAEAAPPPVRPIPWPHVVTTPAVPMSSRGVRMEPSSRWMIQPGVPLELGDKTAPKLGIAVTMLPRSVSSSKLVLDLKSATPLKVRFGTVDATTPTRIVVDLTTSSPPLLLTDPQSQTSLEVRFTR